MTICNPGRRRVLLGGAMLAVAPAMVTVASAQQRSSDPLASWNEGAAKKSITGVVARVTTKGSPDFIAPAARIATFDNDGTLWSEQPMYLQLAFDRLKAISPQPPDMKAIMAGGENHIGKLDKALGEAGQRGWTLVDMKTDWKVVYPFERSKL